MIQFFCLLLFLRVLNIVNGIVPISSINLAAYVPDNSTNSVLYTGTYSECICFAFFSNVPSPYQALNYYKDSGTCVLFTNFLSRSYIKIDPSSRLVHIPLPSNTSGSCVDLYDRCGGNGWTGLTTCCAGLSCVIQNPWYSQCVSTTTTISTTLTTTSCVPQYYQCGGNAYSGSTTCCAGSTCVFQVPLYSQCRPTITTTTVSTNLTATCVSQYNRCGGNGWFGPYTCCAGLSCVYQNDWYLWCELVTTTVSTNLTTTSCVAQYQQCGGSGWSGSTTCCAGLSCVYYDVWNSRCDLITTTVSSTLTTTCVSQYQQCGGNAYSGPTTCCAGLSCVFQIPMYSQCRPTTTTTVSTNLTTTCVPQYQQCGGNGYQGPYTCCAGSSCVYQSQWYLMCDLVTTTLSTNLNATESTTTVSNINVDPLNATTGYYWGCCKVSCAWSNKAPSAYPVQSCAQDGHTVINSNTQSICNNGGAYVCNNQQPWSINATFSYGYAGAVIENQGEWNWCCTCYSLSFTSSPLIGKQMIVQVVNSLSPPGNIFVLQIPGSGWGVTANGCLNQYNSSYSWGNQFGGISNRSDCVNLPSVLQPGCYWRFDWFMNANQPSVQFKQVTCPSDLTSNTGCIRYY